MGTRPVSSFFIKKEVCAWNQSPVLTVLAVFSLLKGSKSDINSLKRKRWFLWFLNACCFRSHANDLF